MKRISKSLLVLISALTSIGLNANIVLVIGFNETTDKDFVTSLNKSIEFLKYGAKNAKHEYEKGITGNIKRLKNIKNWKKRTFDIKNVKLPHVTLLSVFVNSGEFKKKYEKTKKAISNALKTKTMQQDFKHAASYSVQFKDSARPFSKDKYFWVGQKVEVLNQKKLNTLVDKIKYQLDKKVSLENQYKMAGMDHISEVEITTQNKQYAKDMIDQMKGSSTKFKDFLNGFKFSKKGTGRLMLIDTDKGRIKKVLGWFGSDGTFWESDYQPKPVYQPQQFQKIKKIQKVKIQQLYPQHFQSKKKQKQKIKKIKSKLDLVTKEWLELQKKKY